ncbi:hypothetical protein JCM3774_006139 [Rhodotorula dairenensis]
MRTSAQALRVGWQQQHRWTVTPTPAIEPKKAAAATTKSTKYAASAKPIAAPTKATKTVRGAGAAAKAAAAAPKVSRVATSSSGATATTRTTTSSASAGRRSQNMSDPALVVDVLNPLTMDNFCTLDAPSRVSKASRRPSLRPLHSTVPVYSPQRPVPGSVYRLKDVMRTLALKAAGDSSTGKGKGQSTRCTASAERRIPNTAMKSRKETTMSPRTTCLGNSGSSARNKWRSRRLAACATSGSTPVSGLERADRPAGVGWVPRVFMDMPEDGYEDKEWTDTEEDDKWRT